MSEPGDSGIKTKPPVVTLIISIIAFASTIIGVVGGLSLLWPGTVLDDLWKLNPAARNEFMRVGSVVVGLLLLCLGALSSGVGVGLLTGKAWAWWLALVLLVVVLGVNLTRLVTGDPGELFGTPFTAVLLWLHLRPTVRKFFLLRR